MRSPPLSVSPVGYRDVMCFRQPQPCDAITSEIGLSGTTVPPLLHLREE